MVSSFKRPVMKQRESGIRRADVTELGGFRRGRRCIIQREASHIVRTLR